MPRLRHSNDSEPGYTRVRRGKGWSYHDVTGAKVTDKEVIARLNGLAMPPAYRNVWYCKDENGHIQATGYDARGRKQYRYHEAYREQAEAEKYEGCVDFGSALPKLRKQVAKDLRRRKLSREAVVAAVIRLLDTAYIRVGNQRYADENKSFGATTLRVRHVEHQGPRKVHMRYRGKGGVMRDVVINDRRLARMVRRCGDLPGQDLFQYVNGDGRPNPVNSSDVNDYIRDATGTEFTAKHFRTWGASVIATEAILAKLPEEGMTLAAMLEPVAEALGNTPAIARKSYVHPALIEAVKEDPLDPLEGIDGNRPRQLLSPGETALMRFLERQDG